MKRLSRILLAAGVALMPFAAGGSAFAASTCQVGYTGPDSNNKCTLTSTYTCKITNNNDFEVTNQNDQTSISGTAKSTGNTSSGGAISGSATNSNGTTVNVTLSNGTCTVVKTVPVTPSQPKPAPKPVTPSGGKGSFSPVVKQSVQAPQQKAAPAVLPNTSGDHTTAFVLATTGVLAGGALLSRLALATYGRLKS